MMALFKYPRCVLEKSTNGEAELIHVIKEESKNLTAILVRLNLRFIMPQNAYHFDACRKSSHLKVNSDY